MEIYLSIETVQNATDGTADSCNFQFKYSGDEIDRIRS